MASDGVWVPDPDAEDKYPPPKKGMNRMTLKLIRKRAEHNEGIISTLEELTLHQEELVAIEPCLGTTCRKLKNFISPEQYHLEDPALAPPQRFRVFKHGPEQRFENRRLR